MSAEESQEFKSPKIPGQNKSRIPKLRRCSSLRSKGEHSRPRLQAVNSGEIHMATMDVATPLSTNFSRIRSQTSPDPSMRKLSLPLRSSVPQSPTYSDDGDNMSVCSTMSCGPTMMGTIPNYQKDRRCVVHCSRHHEEPEEYLTPTQRANREIKQLKSLLRSARRELNMKELEIERLTKELMEMKLSLGDKDSFDGDSMKSPEDQSPKRSPQEEIKPEIRIRVPLGEKFKSDTDLSYIGKEGVRKSKMKNNSGGNGRHSSVNGCARSPQSLIDIPHSLTDSGHFDDLVSSSMGSKESLHLRRLESDGCDKCSKEEKRLQEAYERKLDEIKRSCAAEYQELKEKHNDKYENILQKLDDANSRNFALRKESEDLLEKNKQLQTRMDNLQQEMADQEIKHHEMYLHMYRKGQAATKFENDDEIANAGNGRVTDLIQQLQITETELEKIKALVPQASLLSTDEAFFLWISALRKGNDKQDEAMQSGDTMSEAEVTLQFLKSAVYYFLTDRDNHKGHLRAIQSILGYSELEKINIDRATRGGKYF